MARLSRPATLRRERRLEMKRKKKMRIAGLAAAVTALVFVSVASAHAPQSITIRHQTHGSHAWAFAKGPYKATLKIRVDCDATLRGGNKDGQPRKRTQVAGPR